MRVGVRGEGWSEGGGGAAGIAACGGLVLLGQLVELNQPVMVVIEDSRVPTYVTLLIFGNLLSALCSSLFAVALLAQG